LRGDMVSSVREDGSLSLIDGANGHGVIYAQATDVISLPALPPGVTAWAVDTRASYQRLPIEATLDGPEPGSWRAPHVSDWAVALEAAPRRRRRRHGSAPEPAAQVGHLGKAQDAACQCVGDADADSTQRPP